MACSDDDVSRMPTTFPTPRWVGAMESTSLSRDDSSAAFGRISAIRGRPPALKRLRFDYFVIVTALVGVLVAMNLIVGDLWGAVIVGGGMGGGIALAVRS